MGVLTDNKELLSVGAKLELCGEWENAAEVYLTCVRETAALSDGTDALEFLYGRRVYDEPIRTYSKAAEYAFIAACSKKLVELIRGKFPNGNCFETPSGAKSTDAAMLAFFEWLTKRREPQNDDYKILKKAKASLDKKDKVLVEVSASVARRNLAEVVSDLVNGGTKVVEKKLK